MQKPSMCFYFQVHQPFRLNQYNVFQIGNNSNYWFEQKNREVMEKVTRKCYIPTNRLMLNLIHKHPEFKVSYSITGTALEQFQAYSPRVIDLFEELSKTGNVEFLSETYYHSLSYLYSKSEFIDQVSLHRKTMKKLFKQTPAVFRNTELIYNNELASFVEKMGFNAILAEGAEHILGWRSPNYVYKAKTTDNLKLLLKNYKLSDDIAFRFGNPSWEEYPLTAEKYASWVDSIRGHSVNLFMDYETFGEHQWEYTGIFNFLRNLPFELLKRGIKFQTPSELAKQAPVDEIDIHSFISWADVERDLSAWLGNDMQNSAMREIYKIEEAVKKTKNQKLVADWRKLTTSDHFYYMCVKWFNDGDVHKYFNPYESPYDSYIAFMNVLNDIVLRIKKEKNPLIKEQMAISHSPSTKL